MAKLSASDYRAGLNVVQRLAAARGTVEFARLGVELIGALVPSELTTLSVCDLAASRRTPERGRDARRFVDRTPSRRTRRCAKYAELYRRVGIDHVIAVPLHVDERLVVSFVLNRSRRDFSDRERQQLDVIAGSLGQLYEQAVALDRARATARALDHQLAAGASGCIHIGARGSVRDFSPRAAELALRLWGTRLRRGATLPVALNDWLARPSRRALPAAAAPPRVRSARAGRLTVRTFPSVDQAEGWLLVLEESIASPEAAPADHWALTPSEREVMRWLAAGKTDRDIGAILGISPRTVHKHLQRIYTKLGVETRTAAVSRWLGPR